MLISPARMPLVRVSNCSNAPSVFCDAGRLPRHAIPLMRILSGLLLRSPRGSGADGCAIAGKFIVDAKESGRQRQELRNHEEDI